MKPWFLVGLLAIASPAVASEQDSSLLPPIGWTVTPGRSSGGSNICTLAGDLGGHRALALLADAAVRPPDLTLLFDDGGVKPRPQPVPSRLTVTARGSSPLSISGSVTFGQFKTTLTRATIGPFLFLVTAKRRMTIALDGGPPILVNLEGTTVAVRALRRCEVVQNIHQPAPAPARVAATPVPPVVVAAPLPAPTASAVIAPVAPAPAVPPALAATAPLTAPFPAPPSAAPALPGSAPMSASGASPTSPVPVALDPTMRLLSQVMEAQFIAIVQDGAATYENTGNEAASRGARATRATNLCALLGHDNEAHEWTGTIVRLANGTDRSDLSLKLADDVTVSAVKREPSHGADHAIADPVSSLVQAGPQMHIGEAVTFSGYFLPSSTDCFQEASVNEDSSMRSPNFLMNFTSVEAKR
ncbi:MAG: hypothetical protein HIU92_16060 [Proteobacteria bacterium]|nr:hypothetical protein [Pseudomonadota bacterium]